MKIQIIKTIALSIVGCLFSLGSQAQSDGIYGPGGSSSTSGCCIPADGLSPFTITLPGTTQLTDFSSHTWSAKGGIEIVGSADGSSVTVRAKSDVTRDGHFAKFAKGRLYFGAKAIIPSDATCSQLCNPYYSYSIDVYKIFDVNHQSIVNKIVGPECVLKGDTVTYSVDPWVSTGNSDIGMDKYNWILPATLASSILYYSADSSSITFKVGRDVVNTDSIKVEVGHCNFGVAHNYIVTAVKNATPDPIFNKSLSNYCLPFGTKADTIVITNKDATATYTWDMRSWASKVHGDTLFYTPQDNAQTVRLSVVGGCTNKQFLYDINRSLDPKMVIAATHYGSCVPKDTTIEFSIAGVPVGTEMHWTLGADAKNAGWSIATGDSAVAKPMIHVGTGIGTVYATTKDCATTTLSKNCHIKVTKPTAITASKTCLARRSENLTFQIPTASLVTGATGYNWRFPSTWTKTAAAWDSSSVNITTDGIHAGTVKVRAIGCDTSKWDSIVTNLAADTPSGINFSQSCLNIGTTDTITCKVIKPSTNNNYAWNVSGIGQVLSYSGSNDSSVVVVTDGTTGNKTIGVQVQANGSCVASSWKDSTITVTNPGYYMDYFDGLTEYFVTLDDNLMHNPCSACTYKWWLSNNGTASVLTGTSYAKQIADIGDITTSTQYLLFADVKSSNGCRVRVTKGNGPQPTNYNQLRVAKLDDAENAVPTLKISPNPTTNILYGILNDNGTDEMTIRVYTLGGRLMLTKTTDDRLFSIDTANFAAGTYVISVISNGKKYEEKVIKK